MENDALAFTYLQSRVSHVTLLPLRSSQSLYLNNGMMIKEFYLIPWGPSNSLGCQEDHLCLGGPGVLGHPAGWGGRG